MKKRKKYKKIPKDFYEKLAWSEKRLLIDVNYDDHSSPV